ncbi:sodium-dependent transporter, partial [uncultured Campylobacter sp.]|uniref:sodium-dependent transporter n=1 Tax=uncultured Campylobacter sp. TaxID=218934 RepID=UPI002619AEE9
MAQDKFSKIGFILAVAGSAVGLGNAWKFPYLVGQNGGSAFVLLYLFMTFFIGLAIFFGEIAIGKLSESDPVNAFKKLAPKRKEAWKFAGFTMIGAIIIASFYTVIIGWILKYAVMVITELPKDVEASEKIFGSFYANDAASQIFYFTIVFFLCIFIVSKGIKSGIERVNVWMMPSLLILLIIMLS